MKMLIARRIDQRAIVPRNFLFDGDVKEWQAATPTFVLAKYQPPGREGTIWIGQAEQGLIIVGKIRGDKTITIFEEHSNYDSGNGGERRRWTKNDYCLDLTAGEYNECGSQDPSPRLRPYGF